MEQIMKKGLLFTLLCFTFIFNANHLYSQVDQTGVAGSQFVFRSAVNYYYYAKPGDLTITVNVWGFVQRPGLYEVASSTDLVRLISLAGGPAQYADMDEVRIIRITKDEDGIQKIALTLDMNDLSKLQADQLGLKPGDVIEVNHTSWFTLKDVFQLSSYAAVLITAIATLLRVYK